jgi:hypothetical protein
MKQPNYAALLRLADALGGMKELAEVCGVAVQKTYQWAAGERRPRLAMQVKLNELARRRKLSLPFPDAALGVAQSSDAERYGDGSGAEHRLAGAWGRLATAVGGIGALAAAIGVTRQAIRSYAKGRYGPSAAVAAVVSKLAEKHGIRW